ncbi:MAG: hypothetical protein OXC71_02775 [Chloroflexi bacterium]|nr:hypothetical protein [Chloroflexota bacterium]
MWLADLLMLSGACAVVVASPFGLAWYLIPPLIYVGIGTAFLGLAVAPSRWRACVFVGIALSWMQAGLVILIGLGVGKFLWPRLRVTAHPVADSLLLVAGACLLIGWYGGWTVPLTMSAVAALVSLLLDRRNHWRAGLFASVLVVVVASLLVR